MNGFGAQAAVRQVRQAGRPLAKTNIHVRIQTRQLTLSSYLVSPKQLHEALKENSDATKKIVPLCASWFLPNDPEKRTGLQVFREKRIPGARFFDIDAVKDQSSPYPHMLPSAEDFAKAMGSLGVRNEDAIVVYDTKELGIFSAPRVAWTLRIFGHGDVHVLNNFRIWVDEGYPTESGVPGEIQPAEYAVPKMDKPKEAVDFDFVKKWAKGELDPNGPFANASLVDARPRGRWAGTSPEPRPGLPSGHIPGSVSVPFSEVLHPKTRAFLPRDQLREAFRTRGVSESDPIIASCGTGVSAAVLDAALEEADYQSERYLYDGSWTEWAQRVKPEEDLIHQSYS